MKVYILFCKRVFSGILEGVSQKRFLGAGPPLSFYLFLHACQAFPRLQLHNICAPVIQLTHGCSNTKCTSLLLCLSLMFTEFQFDFFIQNSLGTKTKANKWISGICFTWNAWHPKSSELSSPIFGATIYKKALDAIIHWEPNVTAKMASLAYHYFLLKKFINNYKQTMPVQYLVSLQATSLRKPNTRSAKTVNSPQVNKRTSYVHLLVES